MKKGLCENCGLEMPIFAGYDVTENDNTETLPTKLYHVTVHYCKNAVCPQYGVPFEQKNEQTVNKKPTIPSKISVKKRGG